MRYVSFAFADTVKQLRHPFTGDFGGETDEAAIINVRWRCFE